MPDISTQPPAGFGPDPWDLLAGLPTGIVLTDGADLTWWNRQAADILGLGEADMAGLTTAELQHRARHRNSTLEPVEGIDGAYGLQPRRDADEERLAVFAEASEALARSLNLDRTLTRIAHLTVPRLADGCLLSFAEGRNILRVGMVESPERSWHHRRPDVPLQAALAAVVRVRSTGASELWPRVEPEALHEFIPTGEEWAPLRDIAPRSVIVVPLRGRSAPIGALVLLGTEGRPPYDDRDVAVAEGLAHRAAVAIDNALIYRERSHVARVLQSSLLPTALPDIPALELGARYRPLTSGSEIGGDFYDVFRADEGSWAIAVGDVCGKGVQAATLTGLARHTIRAVVGHHTDPADVLRALNEAVHEQRSDTFCTVALARATQTGDGVEMVVSTGGHPPAVVLRADGSVRPVASAGTLLGMLPVVEFRTATEHLGPGDSLVLYTDGIVEARSGGREFGHEGLIRSLEGCVGLDADTIADRLVHDVAGFVAGPQTDDIAVVVARVRPEGPPSEGDLL